MSRPEFCPFCAANDLTPYGLVNLEEGGRLLIISRYKCLKCDTAFTYRQIPRKED